ncbi:MAG: endonuclease/exonuclease/phosphatase family protein [Kiritimatiellaeota bacterium]|nr:endonuclease/exonuclease/phosphatase family protein [Kiritimatiellota bacterium]
MGRDLYLLQRRETGGLLAVCLLLLTGCGNMPEAETFSVMTYNVRQYARMDRDGGGEADDAKPKEAREAVIQLIAAARPDVLALQEMGDEIAFSHFQDALREAGLNYPYAELLQRGQVEVNLAVLSRFPIVSVQHRTNDWYRIGSAKVPVARGFIDVDIQVSPTYRFRLMNAHLKSKVYSPLGQTEMRRNEARLLNKAVRDILEETPEVNLLVVGDMNDDYASAPLREVAGRRGGELIDLRPLDSAGDAWTCFHAPTDSHSRFDYLFVNEGMKPEVIEERTRVVRDPLTYKASDHRPVIGVFRSAD